ncbi:hypothetical protein PWT90_10395 [Aphanocladium album]|nr:hypothetical protein PWT90_10395 [Aphanocladium album]
MPSVFPITFELANAFQSLSLDTKEQQCEGDALAGFRLNIFDYPLLYRVICENCPRVGEHGVRPRLYPPPNLQSLSADEMLSEVRTNVERHANWSNRDATPFTSLTPDLLRALHIAFCSYHDKSDVRILIVDPRRLKKGSSLSCNWIRAKCGLKEESIYDTEVLVWGEIPSSSIIHQWQREALVKSGLFRGYPSIHRLPQNTRLAELRLHVSQHSNEFKVKTIIKALRELGMDISSMYAKQVFMFLLGRVEGIEVQKHLREAEDQLICTRSQDIEIFDAAAYAEHIARGGEGFVAFLKQWSEVGCYGYSCKMGAECLHGAKCMVNYFTLRAEEFCPSHETWLQVRQSNYLRDALLNGAEEEAITFEMRLAAVGNKGYYIGFAD